MNSRKIAPAATVLLSLSITAAAQPKMANVHPASRWSGKTSLVAKIGPILTARYGGKRTTAGGGFLRPEHSLFSGRGAQDMTAGDMWMEGQAIQYLDGNDQKAEYCYRQALAHDADDQDPIVRYSARGLAACREAQGDLEGAVDAYRRVFYPHGAETLPAASPRFDEWDDYKAFALLLIETGNQDEALSVYNQMLRHVGDMGTKTPSAPPVRFLDCAPSARPTPEQLAAAVYLAYSFHSQWAASDALERAAQILPDSPAVNFYLGRYNIGNSQYTKADTYFQQASARGDASVKSAVASLYKDQGDHIRFMMNWEALGRPEH